ncbi:hypothetical protein [Sessilibacter corallicola]|uniref:hypothetical protein n=1 Tax=Sessilibacter corallicola TaxID=2904075 RepID=UPI001E4DA874|nr:hypothetical protein [Sessilibacter corallicola]MCE2030323.1 hypothetical protein [Sessilibacter corallicola]
MKDVRFKLATLCFCKCAKLKIGNSAGLIGIIFSEDLVNPLNTSENKRLKPRIIVLWWVARNIASNHFLTKGVLMHKPSLKSLKAGFTFNFKGFSLSFSIEVEKEK